MTPGRGDDHAGSADSAGVPWGGRTLPSTGFEGDDGTRPPSLDAALGQGDAVLVEGLRGVRLLVPVTAVPGEAETDMAVVLLDHPDGRTALPVFSSLGDLAAFDPSLRPVPVTSERAAEAAVTERAHLMVLDCASDHAVEIRPSMMWALAQRQPWTPAHEDPFVRTAVHGALSTHDEVIEHSLEPGDAPGLLVVELVLVPGLSRERLESLVTDVGERLASDGELRARVDEMSFRVR
ncbi:hypothetical protein GCM10022199_21390 [Marihabitans asiaticum]|uniref:Type III secretion system (T3SS) SseB-like protein n=1 Tax=Marihabitans asiaticum TaxID=415218 RepID=A0A560WAX4_9MICO|nr:SseB family protein [Marihabitans asiaticum]TWD14635.1 type III secretion system (T3SS) SseB-like protein [Marihabitans asiaticum]